MRGRTALHVMNLELSTFEQWFVVPYCVGIQVSQMAHVGCTPAGVIARGVMRISILRPTHSAEHRRSHANALATPLLPVFLTKTAAASAVKPHRNLTLQQPIMQVYMQDITSTNCHPLQKQLLKQSRLPKLFNIIQSIRSVSLLHLLCCTT